MTEQNGVGRSATEELRRMLDERGVEWWEGWYKDLTLFDGANGVRWMADYTLGELFLSSVLAITPEQAIAATLGQEDAYTREDVESAFVRGYSLGSLPVGSDPQWDENEQTVDEHMAELGWVRKDAATLGDVDVAGERHNGAGTCKPLPFSKCYGDVVEAGDYEEFWEPACKCSECGELIPMRNFCPNCGRRIEVVDE